MLLDSGNGVMTLSTGYLLLEIKNKVRLAHLFICNLTVNELFRGNLLLSVFLSDSVTVLVASECELTLSVRFVF